jgi:hypothetical protein
MILGCPVLLVLVLCSFLLVAPLGSLKHQAGGSWKAERKMRLSPNAYASKTRDDHCFPVWPLFQCYRAPPSRSGEAKN